jgi:hypothetical protein
MLHDRFTLTHLNHVTAAPKQLSVAQEEQLIAQINSYASRGTLLTHGHMKQLTKAVTAKELSVDWTSRFMQRHSDRIHSLVFTYCKLSRNEADILSRKCASQLGIRL